MEKRVVRAGKGFALFILNEDLVDTINIFKSLENSSVLKDGVTEKVKYEIKKPQEDGYLTPLLVPMIASFIQLLTSSLVKGIFEKESWGL